MKFGYSVKQVFDIDGIKMILSITELTADLDTAFFPDNVVQFILAWFFFSSIEVFFSLQDQLTTMSNPPGVTDLVISPLFRTAGIVLLMVLPLLTMRLISEERRNHTLQATALLVRHALEKRVFAQKCPDVFDFKHCGSPRDYHSLGSIGLPLSNRYQPGTR